MLDLERNRTALTSLRSLTVRCPGGNAAQFPHLEALAEWIGQCPSLRYLFCHECGAFTGLGAIITAPSLISVCLGGRHGVADFTPLVRLGRLRCLVVRHCRRIADNRGFAAPKSIRMLSVAVWPNDWVLLLACNRLGWLGMEGLSNGMAPAVKLIDAAPFPNNLTLWSCSGLKGLDPGTLPRLVSFPVYHCSAVAVLDLITRTELARVAINSCRTLGSVAFGGSIRDVSVWSCAALATLDLRFCLALGRLVIHTCPVVRPLQLPVMLAALESLHVQGCLPVATLDRRTAAILKRAVMTECGSPDTLYPPGFSGPKARPQ